KIYQAGAYSLMALQLTHIRTYLDSSPTPVSDYWLTYSRDANTGDIQLTSVQLCAGDGASTCLPPTTIAWQGGTVSFPGMPIYPPGWTASNGAPNVITGDWNGDGKTDIFLQAPTGPAGGPGAVLSTIFQSTGNGFTARASDGGWWHGGNYAIV